MKNKMTSYIGNFKAAGAEKKVYIEGWANKAIVDDGGDLMNFEGVDLTRFVKNPIMLFNHDIDKPIGKIVEIDVTKDGMWVKAEVSSSTDPFVSYVRDLVVEGTLKTFSIGFQAKKESSNRASGYNEIQEWRLNEISIVTLPMNVEAEFSLTKELKQAKTLDEARMLVQKAMEGDPVKVTRSKKEHVPPKKPEDEKPMDEAPPSDAPPPPPPEKPDEEEKPKDEKGAFEECVSAKIPKLLEEGKPEEQAIAIAMSMCREEGKCDVAMMSDDMFKFAAKVASECKPKKPEDKGIKQDAPPTAPIGQPSDDPTNYGNPHLDIMKAQLAMLGSISSGITKLTMLLEKRGESSENEDGEGKPDGETPPAPPPADEDAEKLLSKISEIRGRIQNIAKSIGV
jgi:hypothetical protein